jgi:hypothetical protein
MLTGAESATGEPNGQLSYARPGPVSYHPCNETDESRQ